MSGAAPLPVAPAKGAAPPVPAPESTADAKVDAAGCRLKRCPAMRAISATSAIAATAHGSADEKLRCSIAPSAPAGVPHRWQNLAPIVSGAPQPPHVAPASEPPQFEQNLPDACVRQFGHVCVASADDGGTGEELIAVKVTRRASPVQCRNARECGRVVPHCAIVSRRPRSWCHRTETAYRPIPTTTPLRRHDRSRRGELCRDGPGLPTVFAGGERRTLCAGAGGSFSRSRS